MERKEKLHFNVPTVETVDYNRIYVYDSNVINPKELFIPYLRNRGGREDAIAKHIQEIKKVILDGGMRKLPPIVVDINTLQIPDGNCRFKALLSALDDEVFDNLTLKVIYEDIPEEEFDDRVIELNTGQKSWSLLDYIYNHKLRGSGSHKKFIEFCVSNETLHSKDGLINPRYGAAALCIPQTHLKKSSLNVTDEAIEVANKAVYEAAEVRKKFSEDANANGGGWYEPYLRAWAEFRNSLGNIPFEEYLKEVSKTLKNRKSEVKVPYGSNKKADWNGFFRTVKSYMV